LTSKKFYDFEPSLNENYRKKFTVGWLLRELNQQSTSTAVVATATTTAIATTTTTTAAAAKITTFSAT
jgi:hypothetical protein